MHVASPVENAGLPWPKSPSEPAVLPTGHSSSSNVSAVLSLRSPQHLWLRAVASGKLLAFSGFI